MDQENQIDEYELTEEEYKRKADLYRKLHELEIQLDILKEKKDD